MISGRHRRAFVPPSQTVGVWTPPESSSGGSRPLFRYGFPDDGTAALPSPYRRLLAGSSPSSSRFRQRPPLQKRGAIALDLASAVFAVLCQAARPGGATGVDDTASVDLSVTYEEGGALRPTTGAAGSPVSFSCCAHIACRSGFVAQTVRRRSAAFHPRLSLMPPIPARAMLLGVEPRGRLDQRRDSRNGECRAAGRHPVIFEGGVGCSKCRAGAYT